MFKYVNINSRSFRRDNTLFGSDKNKLTVNENTDKLYDPSYVYIQSGTFDPIDVESAKLNQFLNCDRVIYEFSNKTVIIAITGASTANSGELYINVYYAVYTNNEFSKGTYVSLGPFIGPTIYERYFITALKNVGTSNNIIPSVNVGLYKKYDDAKYGNLTNGETLEYLFGEVPLYDNEFISFPDIYDSYYLENYGLDGSVYIYPRVELTTGTYLMEDTTDFKFTVGQGVTRFLDYNRFYIEDSSVTRGSIVAEFVPYGVSKEISLFVADPNPYAPGGSSSVSGGGGSFGKDNQGNEIPSDNVSLDLPSGSTDGNDMSSGMYTRYLMNSQYLQLLGDWVYDPNAGLSLVIEFLNKIFGDTSNALISLLSFPFQISAPLNPVTFETRKLFVGHVPTGADFVALTSSSAQIDWGTISLEEYWGNFLDYSPHTKIDLYLPWGTGFVSIDPSECLPGTLTVKTNVEFVRGSCVHNVINDKGCVIGTYNGQCAKMIPLISSDIAAKRAGQIISAVSMAVSGGVSAAGAVGANIAAGEAFAAGVQGSARFNGGQFTPVPELFEYLQTQKMARASNAVKGIANSAKKIPSNLASKSSVASLKIPGTISRNGGFTDGSMGLGIQYPYIVVSRPEQNIPSDYGAYFGYPSNINESLYNLKGYTEIGEIHLTNIFTNYYENVNVYPTSEELSAIENILKGGVIL